MLDVSKRYGFGRRRKVAVVGSGISGLAAAWLLDKSAEVVIFEADSRPGGHANTVDVPAEDGAIAVDTGFIVYNERNYPNLVKLFETLGVTTEVTEMSFAASMDSGAFEYSGTSLASMLGQKSNIVHPRFWRMVRDILKFYRRAPQSLLETSAGEMTLGAYLDAEGYSKSFVDDHILPMGAAIWSMTASEMRAYPLIAFVRFFESHGLLSLTDRPIWRTVSGGSREYVRKLLSDGNCTLRINSPVASVQRLADGVEVRTRNGDAEWFDDVVIATHADQALAILAEADDEERNLLQGFQYTSNKAVLHSDPALMPRRKAVWSSWNYIGDSDGDSERQLCVTYWMNKLHNLDHEKQLFVSLNPSRPIRPEVIHRSFDYSHPLFDAAAIRAQKELWRIQGRGGVWFCGAHFGSGFHEDGLQSGLAVAEQVGGIKRPWQVAGESARIHLPARVVAA